MRCKSFWVEENQEGYFKVNDCPYKAKPYQGGLCKHHRGETRYERWERIVVRSLHHLKWASYRRGRSMKRHKVKERYHARRR